MSDKDNYNCVYNKANYNSVLTLNLNMDTMDIVMVIDMDISPALIGVIFNQQYAF